MKEVKIGDQIWMAENLNVSVFRNGDIIPEAKSAEEWEKAVKNKQPVCCYYENDENNAAKYGKLYNWYAVNDPRGLAPEGWHIPDDTEWITLTNFLGGEKVAGRKMKSKEGWKDNRNGTNKSGFSALPGGYRESFGAFEDISSHTFWWSTSEVKMPLGGETYYAWSHFLCFKYNSLERHSGSSKGKGFYVRCLKDDNTLTQNDSTEKSEVEDLHELVEVCITREAQSDYNTPSIGCEITIGELSTEDTKTIIELIDKNEYFDSKYFREWYEKSSEYHKTGLLVLNSFENILNELEICENSTDNWKFNVKHIKSGLGLSNIKLPKNTPYLISIRNQEFIIYGKIEMPKLKTNYKLDLYYDSFEPLQKFNGIGFSEMAIIHSVKIKDQTIEFDFDKIFENGALNFEINQFIVYNGNIIAWLNGDPGVDDKCPKFQWQIGVDMELPYISNFLLYNKKTQYAKNKATILTNFKKMIDL